MDGLNDDSLKYADELLSLVLPFCFTCMLRNSYMPVPMINSVIILLVKKKCGDLSNTNYYRPIALSRVISIIFEQVILYRLEEYLWTNDQRQSIRL